MPCGGASASVGQPPPTRYNLSVPYREPAQPLVDSQAMERLDDERASIPPAVGKASPREEWFEADDLYGRESVALLFFLALIFGVILLVL